jgi:fibronectin-binding autotransporter adhesin
MKFKPASRACLLTCGCALLATAAHADTLTWDANGATAAQTDGAGAWLGTDQWWTGSANTTWTSGDSAIFGNGGAGGAVTLASPTTVGSLSVGFFTGTYTLGSAGQAITLNNGITRFGGQVGTLAISSPLTLAGAQTWTNNAIATAPLNLNAATTLNGELTIDGDGIINSTATAAVIGGSGKIIKNGTGQFNFSAGGTTPTHTFAGDIVVNGGSIGFQASAFLAGRNVHLTNGYLGGRFGSGFTWTGGLGEGADQIRITGGTSGLSGEGSSNSGFQIGTAGSTLVWGAAGEGSATGYFNPAVLLLNGDHRMNTNGIGSLNNAIDLNGTSRTILSTQVTNGASTSGFTVSGAIVTSSGTAGLTKLGTGNLILTAENTYNGPTTIGGGNAYSGSNPYLVTAPGSITLSGASGRLSGTSGLNLTGGGTLRMVSTNAQNTVDRLNNSAAISVSGGGGLWWENTAGTNSFAETVGNVTVNSGTFNVNLTTNQTGAGSQALTLAGLTRNGTSSLAFSAGGTGPEASGNKNMIVVTGAGTTSPGQIIGAWATTGTAPASQIDYAVYSSDYVTPFGATANNDETTWASTNNINFNAATTLTATRTVNTLRYSGAAATLALGSNVLETTGLLNGGTGLLTLSGTGGLTTPTGGGSLHVTTGSNNITVANPITDNDGTVSLVKSGTAAVTLANGNLSTQGTLVLNGVNTYTGDTIINGGTLRIGGSNVANGARLGGASGDYAGDIQINGGGLLWISSNANQTLSGVISGDGALMKTYSGTLTLSEANTYSGRTSISPSQTSGAGTLVVSSFNSVVSGSMVTGSGTVSTPVASSSLGAPTTVANGTIDLGGPANVQGPATLRYTGSGETTDRVINIRFGSNTSRTIETNGSGLLKFTSPFTFENLGQAAVTTITLQGTGNGEIVGGLPSAGGYALAKNGTGTWTIGGPVGNTGTVTINTNGGTLALQKKSSLFSGNTSSWTADKIIVNSGGTLAVNVGGTGELDNTDVTTLLTNLGGLGGAINNNGLRSGSRIGFDTTNAAGGTFTIADNLANSTGTGGGAIGLTKLGTGTLELTGTNTYTGATTVSAGALIVGVGGLGSTAAGSAVTVAAGATLGGDGTVGGNTTLNGILSPGTSPGTLTFSGNLSVNNGSTYFFEGGDLTAVGGALDLNDTWTLALGAGLQDGGTVTLFTYGTLAASPHLTPTFDLTNLGFTPGGPLSLSDTGSSIVLNGVSIPEPGAALLGGLGLLALLRRRR